jgi:recombination protein RecT
MAVKEGELKKYDPIEETTELELIEDPDKREITETIGYFASFELISGFKKSIFWSKNQMEAHAKRYSKCFSKFWGIYFDKMALKTMIKQLIGTWGIISEELKTALICDNTLSDEFGNAENMDLFEENKEDEAKGEAGEDIKEEAKRKAKREAKREVKEDAKEEDKRETNERTKKQINK